MVEESNWHLELLVAPIIKAKDKIEALEKFRKFLEYLLTLPLEGGTVEKPSLEDYVLAWAEER